MDQAARLEVRSDDDVDPGGDTKPGRSRFVCGMQDVETGLRVQLRALVGTHFAGPP
jgi:hypothetical protein